MYVYMYIDIYIYIYMYVCECFYIYINVEAFFILNTFISIMYGSTKLLSELLDGAVDMCNINAK